MKLSKLAATVAIIGGLGLGAGLGSGVAVAQPGAPIPLKPGHGNDDCFPFCNGPGNGNGRGNGHDNWNGNWDNDWNKGPRPQFINQNERWDDRWGAPPWGWGPPPPVYWNGGPAPQSINYWGYNANPVWNDGNGQWGIWLFGLWIPIFGIGFN
ncbi:MULTISPECIES: hypothetical protein [unclassified Mycobacterium]|uniref:hypothetical protein n=1 Tax=unclassified Mycobacterium TaxID=2642494 RepID=UPI0029C7E5AE|nr:MULTISPECIES: hypothetical protein [unclassified Mycobacterium]